jgi:hypothetical protein
MATPDEIRESELGKAKSLGVILRRSPSTDVWAADYGCFLVYETLDCSGSCAVSKTSTKLKTSLRRGNRSTLDIPASLAPSLRFRCERRDAVGG